VVDRVVPRIDGHVLVSASTPTRSPLRRILDAL